MSLAGAVVTYVSIWAIVLFAVLPFGVRSQTELAPGADPGAPQQHHMGRKLLATTGIATVLWFGVWYAFHRGWIVLA